MSNLSMAIIGIIIPFLGTTIGAAFVFLLKNKMSIYLQKILLGFASGVMIAASIWSLLIPSIEMAREQGKIAWIPATIGFLLGIVGLTVLEKQTLKLENGEIIKHFKNKNFIKIKEKLKGTTMLVLAVTIHNIPEGMAVGVAFAGLLLGNVGITMAGAFALAIGIAIQNIPEGAIISMPLKSEGLSKSKAFIYGSLSGLVEPIGAMITILLTGIIVPILPYLLAFAAGAMIYVVVKELIPQVEEGKYSDLGVMSLAIGFCIMMILDVALG